MTMGIQMQMDDMRKYFRCIDNCLNDYIPGLDIVL